MIRREQLWTGELNRRALAESPDAPARLGLYDTTRPQEECPALLSEVKALGARKHDVVTDEEFRELADGR